MPAFLPPPLHLFPLPPCPCSHRLAARRPPAYCPNASAAPPNHPSTDLSSRPSSDPPSHPPSHPPSLDATLPHLTSPTAPPLVHLVGTGPGDPGLLTLHALRLLQTADVVLYDRLISPQILSLIRPSATAIYVGKQSGFHTRPQHQIHALLAAFAAPGKVVVRLKGGDPFVFGRGGEEAAYLRARGVAVRAVPGVAAASGIAAALGVPLTHRGVAAGARFLTGHVRDGAQVDVGDVRQDTTLVVYMGLAQLPSLVDHFVEGGLRPGTPAVAVERGTTPEQRVVAAPLNELVRCVAGARLQSPTLVIVGDVVSLGPVWKTAMQRDNRLVEGVEGMEGVLWPGTEASNEILDLASLDLEKVMNGMGSAS